MSGSVRVCTHRQTRIQYALKTLNKKELGSGSQLSQLRDEIRIMSQLDHPNILRLHECFENQENVYLILDLCTGGDLLKRFTKDRHYSERRVCELMKTMVSAVLYCHEHSIVHRDLKLQNFLFESKAPNALLKLIDFGFSQKFSPTEALTRDVGSPIYVAPEVLSKNYDERCDVWSLGVIAYVLLSGSPPFYGNTNAEILQAVLHAKLEFNPRYFDSVSPQAIGFIKSCLVRDYHRRPHVKDIASHEWFQMLDGGLEAKTGREAQISPEILDRLHTFSEQKPFQRVCLEVVAHSLTPDQLQGEAIAT